MYYYLKMANQELLQTKHGESMFVAAVVLLYQGYDRLRALPKRHFKCMKKHLTLRRYKLAVVSTLGRRQLAGAGVPLGSWSGQRGR